MATEQWQTSRLISDSTVTAHVLHALRLSAMLISMQLLASQHMAPEQVMLSIVHCMCPWWVTMCTVQHSGWWQCSIQAIGKSGKPSSVHVSNRSCKLMAGPTYGPLVGHACCWLFGCASTYLT